MGRHQGQIQRVCQFCRCGHQGFLWRMSTWMDALHFKIKRRREQIGPVTGTAGRLGRIALLQGFADIARRSAGEGNQPVDADRGEHVTGDFSPPPGARGQIGAGQQFA